MSEERNYIWGQCRNDDYATAHLYETEPGFPMSPVGPLCIYGWNRSHGEAFSILRNVATGPRCKICEKRAEQNKGWVQPKPHKTKWL